MNSKNEIQIKITKVQETDELIINVKMENSNINLHAFQDRWADCHHNDSCTEKFSILIKSPAFIDIPGKGNFGRVTEAPYLHCKNKECGSRFLWPGFDNLIEFYSVYGTPPFPEDLTQRELRIIKYFLNAEEVSKCEI